ncbi:MAG: cytochrome c, partial [Rhodoferax sp.]|nr:cytochrome c [Rhodoferax sp.]
GLSVLPAMEAAVEGGARQLADAAERGDMVAAAQHYGTITSGCVACHNHFRGQPGASAYAPRLKR